MHEVKPMSIPYFLQVGFLIVGVVVLFSIGFAWG